MLPTLAHPGEQGGAFSRRRATSRQLDAPAPLLATRAASALLLVLLGFLRNRLTPLALCAAADLVLLTSLILVLR